MGKKENKKTKVSDIFGDIGKGFQHSGKTKHEKEIEKKINRIFPKKNSGSLKRKKIKTPEHVKHPKHVRKKIRPPKAPVKKPPLHEQRHVNHRKDIRIPEHEKKIKNHEKEIDYNNDSRDSGMKFSKIKPHIPKPPKPDRIRVRNSKSLFEVDGTNYLKTDVDKLYELLVREKKMMVSSASKRFGVTEDRVEEWGKILEEHELIDLHYPPIGKPVLRIRGYMDEGGAKTPEEYYEKAMKGKITRRVKMTYAAAFTAVGVFVALIAGTDFGKFLGGIGGTIRPFFTGPGLGNTVIYSVIAVIVLVGLMITVRFMKKKSIKKKNIVIKKKNIVIKKGEAWKK